MPCRVARVYQSRLEKTHFVSVQVLLNVDWLYAGECGMTFTSGANNSDNCTALESHYMEKFGRADYAHLAFIRRHSDEIGTNCLCGVCGNFFTRPVDLFRHLASKTRNKNAADSAIHSDFFEEVVWPFVGTEISLCYVLSLCQLFNP